MSNRSDIDIYLQANILMGAKSCEFIEDFREIHNINWRKVSKAWE